jgi:predicted dehydrogenase
MPNDRLSRLNRRRFLAAGAAASALSLGAMLQRSAAAGKKKIKIGQIGTGHGHSRTVFSSLREVTDDYEIVGVVENDPVLRDELGGSYQGVSLVSEEQLLNTPGLQAVVVETEVRDLLPTAVRCVNAGMHIHLDKPPGESVPEYKALLDDATRKNLTVQMGYIYRYHPAFQFCYRAVREGWFGDVFEVRGVMSKKIGAASRTQLAEFAGGSMFEIGCHVIDAIVKVLGKPHKITPFVRRTYPERDSLADNQLAVFEYPGATASLRSSLIEYQGGSRRQFTVCGNLGTFDLRPLGGTEFRLALEKPREGYKTGYQDITLPSGPRGFVSAFRDLAAIIRGEKETDYPPAHDLAVHEAVLLASGYPFEE